MQNLEEGSWNEWISFQISKHFTRWQCAYRANEALEVLESFDRYQRDFAETLDIKDNEDHLFLIDRKPSYPSFFFSEEENFCQALEEFVDTHQKIQQPI